MDTPLVNRRDFLKTVTASGLALSSSVGPGKAAAADTKPNVLFIAVDDLRPQLGCYGHKQMLSPNIDRLASGGSLFSRAYCQVPVCGATRASLMTGIRPSRHRFIDYYAKVDEDLPGAVSLGQHFRENGYHTISNGKIFHHANDELDAWSEKPWRPKPKRGSGRNYQLEENLKIDADFDTRGPAFEAADVPDNAYFDGMIADKAIDDLGRLKDSGKPFFLATGFMKPHLPFNAPKKYWDMYNRDDIDLADNPFRPNGAPDVALHNWVELRRYYNIPTKGPLDDDTARSLVHGYYTCVSYMDAQVGRVLDELDRLGLRDNTIVVLWGDHGWQLGEHGLWCKHCNFETSLHVPLIISVPGSEQNQRSDALVEFVDIYPSLSELCGLPVKEHLEGTSFVPLLKNPDTPWKNAVFSRYINGDSVKTDRYRYTEWTEETIPPGAPLEVKQTARMLYDHRNDPNENVNIAEQPENKELVERLSGVLHDGWKTVRPEK